MKKIISILMTGLILVSLVGCGTNSTQNNNSTDQTTATATTTGIVERWNEDGTFKLDAQPNTSAAVDEIMTKAKEDSKNYYAISSIIDIIKNDSVNPFNNRGTMEQLMYFGRVLETNNTTYDNEKQIGVKAYETVKYVYRNAETVEKAKAKQGELLQLIKQYNSK